METEELDCLHDEGAAYAQALHVEGGEVQLEDVPGTVHGFDVLCGTEIAGITLQKRMLALRQAFSR